MGKTSYGSIDELDAVLEKIVSNTVKHFYTDWKNHDRPKYMRMKGSSDSADKKLVLLARTCGTYLLRQADVETEDDCASQIFKYFTTQEPSQIYNIDLENLSIERVA